MAAAHHHHIFSAVAAANGSHHLLEDTLTGEAHLALTSTEEFFSVILPTLFVMAVVFTGFLCLACLCQSVWACLFRQCRAPIHWRRFVSNAWLMAVVIVGLYAAFSVSGFDFTQLSVTLIVTAFIGGANGIINNYFDGLMLQSHDMYEKHQTIELAQFATTRFKILKMGMFHAELMPVGSEERTLIVPNSYLNNNPTWVDWEKGKNSRLSDKENAHPFNAYTQQGYRLPDYNPPASSSEQPFVGRFSGEAEKQQQQPDVTPEQLTQQELIKRAQSVMRPRKPASQTLNFLTQTGQ